MSLNEFITKLEKELDALPDNRREELVKDFEMQIQKAIEHVSRVADVPLIDLQEGLYNRPDLLPDALHPVAEGAGILARTVYSALTGDYGGLQMPAVYGDNMVLQREKALVLQGIANSGEKVSVEIGKQKKKAVMFLN